MSYVENYFHQYLSWLVIIWELIQSHWNVIYLAGNLINTQTFYINTRIKHQIKFIELVYNAFSFPCEKTYIVSLTSSIIKNIVVFPARFRFPGKLIGLTTFELASVSCCLLKSIAISLQIYFSCALPNNQLFV